MAVLSTTNLTLLDLAKRTDPDGQISSIVELLSQENEILRDMTFINGNLETGHKSTARTGIPTPVETIERWRTTYQVNHTSGYF